MIISLFMGDAPLRDGAGPRRRGARGRPPGQEAGELPRGERKDEEFDHGAVDRVVCRARWDAVVIRKTARRPGRRSVKAV
jgi:hypothetical protein